MGRRNRRSIDIIIILFLGFFSFHCFLAYFIFSSMLIILDHPRFRFFLDTLFLFLGFSFPLSHRIAFFVTSLASSSSPFVCFIHISHLHRTIIYTTPNLHSFDEIFTNPTRIYIHSFAT